MQQTIKSFNLRFRLAYLKILYRRYVGYLRFQSLPPGIVKPLLFLVAGICIGSGLLTVGVILGAVAFFMRGGE